MKQLFTSLLSVGLCLSSLILHAQQPFSDYGYTAPIATLSDGQFQEMDTTGRIVEIGSVLFDRVSMQVVAFKEVDTLYDEATLKPQITSRWTGPDPLAEKYYSISPYAFVANNPIIFYDPDGRKIEWGDQVTKDQKRVIKKALRKHRSSKTYRSLYKQLKRSENRYVIDSENKESSIIASFSGNSTEVIEGDDGMPSMTMRNFETEQYFREDEVGGLIKFNFYHSKQLDSDRQTEIFSDFVTEEIVHAAQYENLNKGSNRTGLPGTVNTEFEAKAIVGQIQSESKAQLNTSSYDKVANELGVKSFKNRRLEGYHQSLRSWYDGLKNTSSYKRRRITQDPPLLLKKLIAR